MPCTVLAAAVFSDKLIGSIGAKQYKETEIAYVCPQAEVPGRIDAYGELFRLAFFPVAVVPVFHQQGVFSGSQI